MAQGDARWLLVRLQGGAADDYSYETLIEPDELILVIPTPFRDGWIRVIAPWEGALAYRQIERDADLRLYVPAE
jgi:hypothetical protein